MDVTALGSENLDTLTASDAKLTEVCALATN